MTKKESTKLIRKNINQYRNSQKKLFWFVTHKLGYERDGLKLNKAVDILIDYLGVENIEGCKRGWLLSEYLKQDLDILKKADSSFYSSRAWKDLRQLIFNKYEKVCMKCNSPHAIVVDHIFPRTKFPDLELDEDNMQILCNSCNLSKSNRYYTDYRKNHCA